MRRSRLALLGIAALAVGIVGIVAVSAVSGMLVGAPGALPVPSQTAANSAVANGSLIYFTATDSSGRALTYQGRGMMMMMRVTCAGCHGPDGHGEQTPMFVSPNITYANLTSPAGMLEPNGERIPPYNDETLKRAITQGIDSQGKPLDWPMPRWQMPDMDLDDLIAFLKTLK